MLKILPLIWNTGDGKWFSWESSCIWFSFLKIIVCVHWSHEIKKLKRKLLKSTYHCIQQHPQLWEGAEHPCFSWYNCRFNWNHLARPSFVELDSVSSVWFLGPAQKFYLQTGKKRPTVSHKCPWEEWVPGKHWAVLGNSIRRATVLSTCWPGTYLFCQTDESPLWL